MNPLAYKGSKSELIEPFRLAVRIQIAPRLTSGFYILSVEEQFIYTQSIFVVALNEENGK